MPGYDGHSANLGMNDATVGHPRHRKRQSSFCLGQLPPVSVQMYGDVVLGMKPQHKTDIDPFEAIMDNVKEEKGVKFDNELDVDDLDGACEAFQGSCKGIYRQRLPRVGREQLWGGICAVFDSWMNERAIVYHNE